MNKPACTLSNSMARWCGLPAPAEPKFTLPGLALALAMKSLASLASDAGPTTSTMGNLPISVTGAKSLSGL